MDGLMQIQLKDWQIQDVKKRSRALDYRPGGRYTKQGNRGFLSGYNVWQLHRYASPCQGVYLVDSLNPYRISQLSTTTYT